MNKDYALIKYPGLNPLSIEGGCDDIVVAYDLFDVRQAF